MFKNKRSWQVLWIVVLLTLLTAQQGATQTVPSVTVISPTNNSVVSSPIHLQVELGTNAASLIRISLINGSGFTIARQLLPIKTGTENLTAFETWLPFEIPAETSEALLTVSLLDEFRRPQSLRSVPLTLSSESSNEILQDNLFDNDWLTIHSPSPGERLSGGLFHIEGSLIPPEDNLVYFELMTESGRVIGNAFLSIESKAEPLSFDLPISYRNTDETGNVRLVVRQSSDEYPSIIILDSLLITLAP
jgi:hypothetical protein